MNEWKILITLVLSLSLDATGLDKTVPLYHYLVPHKGIQTTTVIGGWELSIPQTSKKKDLAWELITLMVKPDIIAPMLAKTGYFQHR